VPRVGGDRTLAEMRAETRGDETPAVVSFLLDENLNERKNTEEEEG
jgi:hypothetical protein